MQNLSIKILLVVFCLGFALLSWVVNSKPVCKSQDLPATTSPDGQFSARIELFTCNKKPIYAVKLQIADVRTQQTVVRQLVGGTSAVDFSVVWLGPRHVTVTYPSSMEKTDTPWLNSSPDFLIDWIPSTTTSPN